MDLCYSLSRPVSFGSEETEEEEGEEPKTPRDLVYEAMKMRTGFTESRDKDAIRY